MKGRREEKSSKLTGGEIQNWNERGAQTCTSIPMSNGEKVYEKAAMEREEGRQPGRKGRGKTSSC